MKNQIVSSRPRWAFAPTLAWIQSAWNTLLAPDGRLESCLLVALLALVLPQPTSAQSKIPLIPALSDVDTSSDADAALGPLKVSHLGHTRGLVYADPAKIEYGLVLPSTLTAAASGPDIQVNDPSLDNIQILPHYSQNPYPWEFATESETTLVADGNNIVVSYNSLANIQVVTYQGDPYFTHQFISAYSVSHDGGQSWKSGFLPPSAGSVGTFGDGALAKDRAGNFYYASLAQDAAANACVIVGKSTDRGDTFGAGQIVALDPYSDKEWIAVGPDPVVPTRDNVYVAWTSADKTGTHSLAYSRSTDGGMTWSPAQILFYPTNDGTLRNFAFGVSPVVDQATGRLYISFLQFGDGNPDYLRVLASNDGGNTFTPLAFNVPGAPNPFVYPLVRPGILADCGLAGGMRLVVKQGPDIGGGWWGKQDGLPRFVHCTRLVSQPSTVAQNGRLVIVLATSTSTLRGDPTSQSQLMALYSNDGGNTWFPPFALATPTTAEPQHFMPASALSPDGNTLYVGYYVQQSNEQVRTDLATFQVLDSGLQFLGRQGLSSVAFDLEPNNIPSPFDPWSTINFDQFVTPGYALGEYMGVAIDGNGNPIAAWGDSRNSWTSPANGLDPGVHPQTDVFFVRP